MDKYDRLRSLQSWLSGRIRDVEFDKILKACVDKYYVCFFRGDVSLTHDRSSSAINNAYLAENICIDELEIFYDKYEVEFNAIYIHTQDNENTSSINIEENEYELNNESINGNIFTGHVKRIRANIEILLKEQDSQTSHNHNSSSYKTTIANYVLLSFCVPESNRGVAKKSFDKYQYFPGLISGLSDEQNNPVSYRALIVKRPTITKGEVTVDKVKLNLKEPEKDNSLLSKKILQYFRRHLQQSQIKVYPISNNLSDKYQNIDLLISNGGEIKISQKKNDLSNFTFYLIICVDEGV